MSIEYCFGCDNSYDTDKHERCPICEQGLCEHCGQFANHLLSCPNHDKNTCQLCKRYIF